MLEEERDREKLRLRPAEAEAEALEAQPTREAVPLELHPIQEALE